MKFLNGVDVESENTPTVSVRDTTNNLVGRLRAANSYVYLTADHGDTVGSSRIVFQVDGNSSAYVTNGLFSVDGHIQLSDTYKIQWGGSNARIDGSNASDYIRLWTSDTERMRITSSGNVGIGTTSPSQKLEVNGNFQFSQKANSLFFGSSGSDGTWGAPKITRIGSSLIMSDYNGVQFGGYDGSAYGARMTVKGTGNVGIGTTSPGSKLHISGATDESIIRLQNTATSLSLGDTIGALQFYNSDTTDDSPNIAASIYATAGPSGGSGYLSFRTTEAGTEGAAATATMTLTNGGNVGIGTTSPTSKLHVAGRVTIGSIGTTAPQEPLMVKTETAAYFPGIKVENYNSEVGLYIQNIDGYNAGIGTGRYYNSGFWRSDLTSPTSVRFDQGVIRFYAQSGVTSDSDYVPSERMRITAAGNVGIGSTAPAAKLNVASTGTNAYSSTITKGTNMKGIINALSNNADDMVGVYFGTGTTSEGTHWSGITGSRSQSATDWSTQLNFYTHNEDLANITTATQKMVIKGNGNVGIGTTSPSEKLDVVGNIELGDGGSGASLKYNSTNRGTILVNGSEIMRLEAAGNVGIGTTSPQKKLDVYLGTNNAVASIAGGISSGEYAGLHFGYSETGNSNYRHSAIVFERDDASHGDARGKIHILNSASGSSSADLGDSRLTVLPSGNVGIGTTSPAQKLEVAGNIKIGDSNVMYLGAGNDLQIYHDGTNSVINNTTGNLQIYNNADDGDIEFISDDGSGGTATYFYLDGGGAITRVTKNFRTDDNAKLQLGSAGDASLYHNGTNTVFVNDTGHLIFENRSDDKDIYFKSDDGSGDVTTYFFLDGGSVATQFSQRALFIDNIAAEFGSSRDLKIYHDATNSQIANFTGDLVISNYSDDKDIYFKSDDGSGNVANYFYLDGSGTRTIFEKLTRHNDNVRADFGTDSDLRIFHDSSNSYIQSSGTGDIIIQQRNDDKDIVFQSDDGSGGVTNYIVIDGSTTENVFYKNAALRDSVKATFGNSNDLQIYHDGSNSYINETGTGVLSIQSDGTEVQINKGASEYMGRFITDAGVKLYYDNSLKFETSNTGVTVTGAATATTFLGDLNGTINTATTAVTKANATNDTTVATTAFVQNLIGTIPAGLVFQGTWNATTNTPTLTSGSGTTGHFYIVSTDGSTNLDGVTDWKVGDWAVFIEQGGTDAWEKIDNSSVLGGAGTGGKVPIWSGTGTSVTLADAPITVSGNNATFAGTIDSGTITSTGIVKAATTFQSTAGSMTFYVPNVGQALEIAQNTGNATFAGDVTATANYTAGNSKIIYKAQRSGGAVAGDWSYDDATTDMSLGTSTAHSFSLKTGNTRALTLDSSQNATFAGNVTLNTGTAKKLSILASTHNTNTAQTATLELGYTHSGGAAAGNIVLTEDANNSFGADMTFGVPHNNGSGGSTTRTALTLDGGTLSATFSGNVGIGTTSPTYKLSVSGGIEAGGKVTYSKSAGSLTTTGYAVAGLTAGFNGASAGFEFKCYGGAGKYQRIVYSCYGDGTTWRPRKVIDEGTNDLDVSASADGTTITFTYKATSASQSYSPRIIVEATGHSINSTYA